MDKKKLMLEVMDICEQNEALEKENASLKEQLAKKKKEEDKFEDLRTFEKKALFEKSKSYSLDYMFDVKKDGKTLTFFEWLDTLNWDVFSSSSFRYLSKHSIHEIIYCYFIDELYDVYIDKLDKSVEVKKDETK